MIMALLIVLLLIILLAREKSPIKGLSNIPQIKWIVASCLVLTLFQIGMGTQIRQFVDVQMHIFNLSNASKWLNNPPILFYVHRSFSIAVLIIHGYLGYLLYENNQIPTVFKVIIIVLSIEVLTGIWMYYFDFPFSSQPLHLVLAALLFGAQSYFMLILKKQI
jgi:cytochrome c oxidase assembly protein subunit 15